MYKTLNISQYMSSVACICAAGNDGDVFNWGSDGNGEKNYSNVVARWP
jgi:hypothetical protein